MGLRYASLGEEAAGGVMGGLLVTGEATAGVGQGAECGPWSNRSSDIESGQWW